MKTTVEIQLDITPDQLVKCFINWSGNKQANFLNKIGKHFKEADFNAETQCCSLSSDIDKNGRDFIYTLANYIKVRRIKCGSPKEDVLINYYETGGL